MRQWVSWSSSLLFVVAAACGGKAKPAPEATCAQAADGIAARSVAHMYSDDPSSDEASATRGEIVGAAAGACARDAWSADVRRCYADLVPTGNDHVCEDKLGGELAAKLTSDIDVATAPPPPPPSQSMGASDPEKLKAAVARANSAHTGVAECDDFLRAYAKLLQCDKMPSTAVDAMIDGVTQMEDALGQLSQPGVDASAKTAAADGCKQGADALKQSGEAMGCPL